MSPSFCTWLLIPLLSFVIPHYNLLPWNEFSCCIKAEPRGLSTQCGNTHCGYIRKCPKMLSSDCLVWTLSTCGKRFSVCINVVLFQMGLHQCTSGTFIVRRQDLQGTVWMQHFIALCSSYSCDEHCVNKPEIGAAGFHLDANAAGIISKIPPCLLSALQDGEG